MCLKMIYFWIGLKIKNGLFDSKAGNIDYPLIK